MRDIRMVTAGHRNGRLETSAKNIIFASYFTFNCGLRPRIRHIKVAVDPEKFKVFYNLPIIVGRKNIFSIYEMLDLAERID